MSFTVLFLRKQFKKKNILDLQREVGDDFKLVDTKEKLLTWKIKSIGTNNIYETVEQNVR